MSLVDASALFVIMITLAAIPSASVALVVTRSATMNLANGVAVLVGIVLGDLIFVMLAILGLATLSEMMGGFFLVVKFMAGIYLIWFGITLIRSRTKRLTSEYSSTGSGIPASFLAGLFVTLGDVKAIVFYASLFPAFVDVTALTLSDISIIFIVTVVTVGGVKLVYAIGAAKAMLMGKKLAVENKIRLIPGVLMVGAGTYLIAKN
ncbi:Threonine/homoserine/homoserine lactone efflux protein [Nitrosomonas marina]|uniref:Threonine/homoserine/homoserine lactone efflux protein n=1 Tax=Nitrosomonas marina TaxID=917 RepID=A0A1I0GCU2_9PROT|nr:LysE family transporter [Nitrosomonas marina]SET68727.1 Threonine/homoserine/homoserine lactone efflux protein [Nitrosomonas marina]